MRLQYARFKVESGMVSNSLPEVEDVVREKDDTAGQDIEKTDENDAWLYLPPSPPATVSVHQIRRSSGSSNESFGSITTAGRLRRQKQQRKRSQLPEEDAAHNLMMLMAHKQPTQPYATPPTTGRRKKTITKQQKKKAKATATSSHASLGEAEKSTPTLPSFETLTRQVPDYDWRSRQLAQEAWASAGQMRPDTVASASARLPHLPPQGFGGSVESHEPLASPSSRSYHQAAK